MPQITVKDLSTARDKYKARGAAAQPDYIAGVTGSGGKWEAAAAASQDSYNQGVQEAIGRDAFSKGIKSSGGAYFESRAKTLGGQRFASGVQAGAENWSEGFSPYADTLKSINLEPRGPKGDPRNAQRSTAVQMAMRARKLSR